MKIVSLFISFLFCSIALFSQHIGDRRLLNLIYINERDVINNQKQNFGNYVSILNFSSRERYKTYKRNNIRFKLVKEAIILEACSPWGDYYGFLFIDDMVYYYRFLSTSKNKIIFKQVDLNGSFEKNGVNLLILDIIKRWQIDEILKRKGQIGYSILDGHSFVATRVQFSSSHKPQIETYIFEEFSK